MLDKALFRSFDEVIEYAVCWWQGAKGPQWRTTRTTLPLVDGSGNITRLAG